jgi:SWI/SNF-related matrix-associated actin-dependent regulator 1 of chromatin subfamily A
VENAARAAHASVAAARESLVQAEAAAATTDRRIAELDAELEVAQRGIAEANAAREAAVKQRANAEADRQRAGAAATVAAAAAAEQPAAARRAQAAAVEQAAAAEAAAAIAAATAAAGVMRAQEEQALQAAAEERRRAEAAAAETRVREATQLAAAEAEDKRRRAEYERGVEEARAKAAAAAASAPPQAASQRVAAAPEGSLEIHMVEALRARAVAGLPPDPAVNSPLVPRNWRAGGSGGAPSEGANSASASPATAAGSSPAPAAGSPAPIAYNAAEQSPKQREQSMWLAAGLAMYTEQLARLDTALAAAQAAGDYPAMERISADRRALETKARTALLKARMEMGGAGPSSPSVAAGSEGGGDDADGYSDLGDSVSMVGVAPVPAAARQAAEAARRLQGNRTADLAAAAEAERLRRVAAAERDFRRRQGLPLTPAQEAAEAAEEAATSSRGWAFANPSPLLPPPPTAEDYLVTRPADAVRVANDAVSRVKALLSASDQPPPAAGQPSPPQAAPSPPARQLTATEVAEAANARLAESMRNVERLRMQAGEHVGDSPQEELQRRAQAQATAMAAVADAARRMAL